jgi:hypothetical protein
LGVLVRRDAILTRLVIKFHHYLVMCGCCHVCGMKNMGSELKNKFVCFEICSIKKILEKNFREFYFLHCKTGVPVW